MIADRAYRTALGRRVAIEELRACAGTQFDPAVVDAFLAEVDSAVRDPQTPRPTASSEIAAHVRELLTHNA